MMILIDGVQSAVVPADDRGLAYGDGVFRTLRMRGGAAQLWPLHYAKLATDCRALNITPPHDEDLRKDIARIGTQHPDCALRITVTRGSGGRGYACPQRPVPRRMVAASALPDYPEAWSQRGVAVRYCDVRLAVQPRLAGIKHLNRLENVLARAEWSDPAIAEGLLLDDEGNVIEGTRCNLFIVEASALVTPVLTRCGVAGVTRDRVIDAAEKNGMHCVIEKISMQRLEAAREIFLVNSLIDVWPVATLGNKRWTGFETGMCVRKWLDAHLDPSP